MDAKLRMLLPVQELLRLYEQMFVSREFEERCAEQYTKGNITGFLHLYSGQEAFLSVINSSKRFFASSRTVLSIIFSSVPDLMDRMIS